MSGGGFTGKVVLVTGGASGIGKAAAARFADAGAAVVIADVDEAAGAEHAGALGDRAHSVSCDVSDAAAVEAAVDAAVERFGGLDVMVNNAGIAQTGPLVEISGDEWARVLAVNLTGVFHGIKFAAPRIAERGGGSIVSTASIAGLGGSALTAAYGATKAGVVSLTQSAALELRPLGIRVNCVCPGIVETPMIEGFGRDFEHLAGMPLDDLVEMRQGRYGQPDDIARAILHLASDDADFVSGVALPVDNGTSAPAF